MADRYNGRYDAYDDGDASYYGRSSSRYSSSRSNRSDDYSSGSYSSGYRTSGRGMSQSSDARYNANSNSNPSTNLFGDYYSDDDIETYRRSSYTSGTSRRRTSPRRSRYADDAPLRSSSTRSSRRTTRETSTPRTTSDRLGSRRQDSASSYSRYGSYRDSDPYDESYDSYDEPYDSPRGRRSSRGYDGVELKPKRSNLKRNLIIAGVVAAIVVIVGAGMAFAYVNSISENMHKGVDDDLKNALVHTDMANEPFYMLLLGTDTAEWRKEEQADIADTIRSDSMILARIDAPQKKVSLISIDRDTMVEIDGYGTQKINAAYELGGAAGAVKAVSKMTGLDISHYASVDFDGFSAIVDSIGGVEVDVPMAIDDPEAGGTVEAGLQTLNGEQALILCRARHAYDDMDTVGGYIRDGYQRIVLGAIAKKVLASVVLTIANTVKEMSRFVTTDLEVSDIIGLAQIMQGIDPDTDIYTAREPTQSLYIDETWYELLDEEEWAKMIARMEKGLSPSDQVEVDPATGVVLSTTGSKSEASAAASQVVTDGSRRAVNTREPEEDE